MVTEAGTESVKFFSMLIHPQDGCNIQVWAMDATVAVTWSIFTVPRGTLAGSWSRSR